MTAYFSRMLSFSGWIKASITEILQRTKVRLRLRKITGVSSSPKQSGAPRILVLAPDAGIKPHFHTCCMTAKILKELGHEVFLARCFNLLARCPVKANAEAASARTGKALSGVCENCAANSFKAADFYALDVLDLRSLENEALLHEYDRVRHELLCTDLTSFTYNGVPLGAMSAYEVRLAFKALALDQKEARIRQRWIDIILSGVKLYLLTRAAVTQHGFTHVVYFNDYSFYLAARFAVESSGGSACMVTHAYHLGVDRSRWITYRRLGLQAIYADCLQWPAWRGLPLPPATVEEITDDAIYRFSGRSPHTYSPPLSSGFSINPGTKTKKVIVVFTSSPDEAASIESLKAMGAEIPPIALTFGTKCEDCHVCWLDALQAFAAKRKDLEFIVRVHPREGSNKREAGDSEHLAMLKKCMSAPPKNFRVFWPHDQVSSYNLAESADLVLTSWSTIGLESARLGIPVLACARGAAGYPVDDFLEFTESAGEYFLKIDELLQRPVDLAFIRRAYRWWHLAFLSSAVDLSDLVPASDYTALAPYKSLPKSAKTIEAIILGGEEARSLLREKLVASDKEEATAAESAALKRALKRLIVLFVTGVDPGQDSEDVAMTVQEAPAARPFWRVDLQYRGGAIRVGIWQDTSEIQIETSDVVTTRYSPLLRRLCMIFVNQPQPAPRFPVVAVANST